ncbi:MAG: hypothetical protein QW728_07110 [Thermoplasmata archaeon]
MKTVKSIFSVFLLIAISIPAAAILMSGRAKADTPTAQILYPEAGEVITAMDYVFKFKAYSSQGLSVVEFKINNGTWLAAGGPEGDNNWFYSLDNYMITQSSTSILKLNANNTLYLKVKDNGGHWKNTSRIFKLGNLPCKFNYVDYGILNQVPQNPNLYQGAYTMFYPPKSDNAYIGNTYRIIGNFLAVQPQSLQLIYTKNGWQSQSIVNLTYSKALGFLWTFEYNISITSAFEMEYYLKLRDSGGCESYYPGNYQNRYIHAKADNVAPYFTKSINIYDLTPSSDPQVLYSPYITSNTSTTVKVMAFDAESGIKYVKMFYTTNNWATKYELNGVPNLVRYSIYYEFTIPGQAAGKTIQFYFEACDMAGNKAWASKNGYNYRIEVTPLPELEFVYPKNGDTITSSSYVIKVKPASTSAPVSWVSLVFDDGRTDSMQYDGTYYYYEWTNYAIGKHTIRFEIGTPIDTYTLITQTMNVTYQPAPPNASSPGDAGSGKDAGSTRTTALALSQGTFTGSLSSNDTADYYQIVVPPKMNLNLSLSVPSNANFNLVLYNSAGTQKAKSYNPTGKSEYINFTVNNEWDYTTWYIKVNRTSGSGNYTLKITYSPAPSYAANNVGEESDEAVIATSSSSRMPLISGIVGIAALVLFLTAFIVNVFRARSRKKTIKILVPEKKVTIYPNRIKITEELK